MRKRYIIIAITVVILLVSFVAVKSLLRNRDNAVEVITSKVTKGDIISMYSTTGDVESKDRMDYYASSVNKVKKIFVNVGDKVSKGEKLVEFEIQDFTTQLSIAQKQYEIAKLQLDSLKKTKERLSSQSLSNQSQINLQNSSLTSSNSLNIDDQIKIQEKQTEIAYLNVKNIKENILKQQRYIISDISGVVTQLNAKENSMISIQQPVIVVEDLNNLQVAINANQYDAQNIKVGQKAIIKFLDNTYKGFVSKINPSATKNITQTGIDTFVRVYIDITDKSNLRPNYSVDVNIEIGRKENILKIPSEAIITDKYGNEMVYVVDEQNIAHLRDIKTGLSSDIETEVIRSLKENEVVILNPPATVQEGTKVKVKGREDTK